MRMKNCVCLLVCAWIVLLIGSPVWADFYVISVPSGVGTRISSVPYTITAPGFYYLAGDLASTGNGIIVDVDNVTIDLMGFTLSHSGTGGGTGIAITGARENIEIRNGTVRDFPGHGIVDENGGVRHRIINMRLQYNGLRGVHLSGFGHLVQNCNASENGSSGLFLISPSIVTGNVCSKNGADGIYFTGGGTLIGNLVYDNTGYGFYLTYGGSGPYYYVIDGNTAVNNHSGNINGCPPGSSWGVNAGFPCP